MTEYTQFVLMVTVMMFGPIIMLCAMFEIDRKKQRKDSDND